MTRKQRGEHGGGCDCGTVPALTRLRSGTGGWGYWSWWRWCWPTGTMNERSEDLKSERTMNNN